ncbi:Cilia- and flagella-associated protein 20, partial [Cladochytrium tenue]
MLGARVSQHGSDAGRFQNPDALAAKGARHDIPLAGSESSLRSVAARMFRNTFQPLQIWDKKVRNGHIKRITDNDIQSSVLEIIGTNVSTNFITCPAQQQATLGIKLPFLVMIIKNLKKYFTFEVQVLDDKNVRRRFRASNYQSTTRVKPFICTMPMRLDDGWNQIQFNLSDFTRRAYGTNYIETLR